MVYLIHFNEPLHHAQHYCGYTSKDELQERMEAHRRGKGSRLLRAVSKAGIAWEVCRVWSDADRHFERRLKNTHKLSRHCPVCRMKAGHKHA